MIDTESTGKAYNKLKCDYERWMFRTGRNADEIAKVATIMSLDFVIKPEISILTSLPIGYT